MSPLDLKIEGATVIDGTGAAGARTDVGVRDDRIVAVGDLSREHAGRSLNASGKVLAPGFIDMHSHSDWRLWENRRAESKIRQGVTTEVVATAGSRRRRCRPSTSTSSVASRSTCRAGWTSRGRRSASTSTRSIVTGSR
jgi:N-acyl-D-aspartate/D-glutamate deacylase